MLNNVITIPRLYTYHVGLISFVAKLEKTIQHTGRKTKQFNNDVCFRHTMYSSSSVHLVTKQEDEGIACAD